MLRVVGFISALFIYSSAWSGWGGIYMSTSQQGLAVEISDIGEYALYIIENNQVSSVLELGYVSGDTSHLYFSPVESVSAQLNTTTASITQSECTFIWGEAGEFKNTNTACQTTNNNTNTDTNTNTQQGVDITSIFSVSSNTLTIPQLGLPNSAGQFEVYKVTLQVINYSPLQMQLTAAEPVSNPVNALSAIYYPQGNFLYVPVLGIDGGDGNLYPIYEVVMQTISFNPFVLQEFQAYQNTQPTQNPLDSASSGDLNNNSNYDPAVIQMMSEMNQMTHDTNMSIISNMGGNTCYGYDYQCN